MKVFVLLMWQSGCRKIVTAEFEQEVSGNSVWSKTDYYNKKQAIP